MKTNQLIDKINTFDKQVFGMMDLKRLFPDEKNIRIIVKRLLDRQILIRITKGVYRLKTNTVDYEILANQIYFPSYISFESVLCKHGVINQGFNKITLATTRHSKKVRLENTDCEYIQIKDDLFFGFNLIDGVYMADVEKAILDTLYLKTLGKRKINIEEWQMDRINKSKLNLYSKKYPKSIEKILNTLTF